jgi:hypothetical protein
VEKLNDPAKAQHRLLLDDTISAFLLSYEATLQFLKEQLENARTNMSFNNWLNNQPQYDVFMRGLRTLRQFAAHIEVKPTSSKIVVVIGGSRPDGTSATDFSRTWKLPGLSQSDLDKLRPQSKLNAPDLNDWNALVEQSNIETIFKEGLFRLKEVLDKAESIL